MFRSGRWAELRRAIVVTACIALSGAIPAGVQAGSPPPANDQFSNARVINPAALPYSDTIGSGAPSTEANEPTTDCDAPYYGTQWWRFAPTVNGTYRVDTIGSTFNTLIDVYRGTTLAGLAKVECNDDVDSNNADLLVSRVAFKGVAGQMYYIRASVSGAFGNAVTLHLMKVTPPTNDSFANATMINSLPFDTNASNLNATSQPTEPRTSNGYYDSSACQHQRATRWYKYTPSVDQVLWANTFVAADFDTVLGLYTGSTIGTATRITCNDDQWVSGNVIDSSGITFLAKAGVTYRFQVGGFDAESGDQADLPFHLRSVTTENNDAFANAQTFTSLPYSDPFTLRRATRQSTEPTCRPGMVNSVWYRFTPSFDTTFEISTETRDTFDVYVSLYRVTGSGFGGLQFLGCGNAVGTTASSGTTYAIQVETQNAFAPAGNLVAAFGS